MNESLKTPNRLNKPAHILPWLILTAVILFALFAWGSASLFFGKERLKEADKAGQVIAAMMNLDEVRVQEALAMARNAVRFLASLPPVEGIGRALAGGGNDPLDGTSLEVWRQRLEQIGAAYAASHPEIFQIRLIGLADNGRELVRVVRDAAGKVTVAAEDDLQSKDDRPYFLEAVRLPEGAAYLSSIDLNIEHGQIEQPIRPTLRAALPVRNARGKVFGVVVVNLLTQPLLEAIGESKLPDVQAYVTDTAGHYLWHPQPGKAFAHELAPPGAKWQEEFTVLPGGLKARGLTPAVEQAAIRAPDGTDLLVFTRTLRKQDPAGAGGLVLHAAIPLRALDARAWEAVRQELLLVWTEGLISLGLLAFMLLRWRGTSPDLNGQMLDVAPGRTLRLFGLEIPITPTGRWPLCRTFGCLFLPVPMWVAATLLLGQPVEYPFILMLIPVMLAAWCGGLYAGLGATLIAVAGGWDLSTPNPPLDWTSGGGSSGALSAATLLLSGVLVTFVQENVRRRGAQLLAQQRAQHELDLERIEALERIRELKLRILGAIEREQQRIGRDLHDSLGPHLAAIGYAAAFLANELRQRDPVAAAKADKLREMTGDAVSLTRDLARGICPVQIDAAGLSLALKDLARTTSALSPMSVSYYETGNPQVTDPEQSMHLYRIAQEALSNALKHSGGRKVTIALHQSSDVLRLTVADDGKGMTQPADDSRGMGLGSMTYRAHALGGELEIDSSPGEGTIVSCEISHRPPKPEPQYHD